MLFPLLSPLIVRVALAQHFEASRRKATTLSIVFPDILSTCSDV